jgi:hypothetical protein
MDGVSFVVELVLAVYRDWAFGATRWDAAPSLSPAALGADRAHASFPAQRIGARSG